MWCKAAEPTKQAACTQRSGHGLERHSAVRTPQLAWMTLTAPITLPFFCTPDAVTLYCGRCEERPGTRFEHKHSICLVAAELAFRALGVGNCTPTSTRSACLTAGTKGRGTLLVLAGRTLVPCGRPVSGTVVVRDEKGSGGQPAQPVCWRYTLNCRKH